MTKTNNEEFSVNNDGFLSKSELEQFKKIVLEDYGVDLTDDEALEQAIPLVNFFEAVLKDLRKEKMR